MLKIRTARSGLSLGDPHLSLWKSEILANARILIVGCGALGNEVIKNLALLGVKHITIVDYDVIEHSNLEKSVFFRREHANKNILKVDVIADQIKILNPEIEVTAINGNILTDLGLGHFYHQDVIISCVDNRLARLMINRYAFQFNRIWIDGAIENISGRIAIYDRRKNCYECSLTEQEWSLIRQQLGCADVAAFNLASGRIPTSSIAASIIAAIQVQEALKILHGMTDYTLDQHIYYDGTTTTFTRFSESVNKKDSCICAGAKNDPVMMLPFSNHSTLGELFAHLRKELGKSTQLRLRSPLVTTFTVGRDEMLHEKIIAKHKLLKKYEAPVKIIDQISTISENSNLNNFSLAELGIPDREILNILDIDGHYLSFLLEKSC